jgi:3'(2'), 5'-bisphosphate nucleotidase
VSTGIEQGILDVARRSGRTAARLCRAVRDSMGDVGALYKDAREPVTVADYGSQAVILEAVSRAFPDHGVVAEEGAEHLRASADDALRSLLSRLVGEALGRGVDFDQVCAWIDHGAADGSGASHTWVIDPIDGTKGFLRGDQYAVAIGILRDGEPWGGVLACPNLPVDTADPAAGRGVLFCGARGHGVRCEALDGGGAREVRVSGRHRPEEVRILGSVESAHGDPRVVTALIAAAGLGGGVVRLDSQAKYGTVAAGDAEIYLRPQSRPDYRENIWDHLAGVVIVEEAGGRVSDLRGRRLDFTRGRRLEENRGVVATNGRVHDLVLESLTEILAAGGE